MSRCVRLCSVALVCITCLWGDAARAETASNIPAWRAEQALIQVEVADATQAARLTEMVSDVWCLHATCVVALAAPKEREALRKAKLSYQVLYDSIETMRTVYFGSSQAARASQAAYQRFDELQANMHALVAAHPHLARREVFGHSVLGRELVVVRLSNQPERIDHGRPGIMLVGLHHAREWISMEVPYLILKHLLEQYGHDPAVTQALDTREIWIVPCLNPDGLEYSHTVDRYWRKNLADNNKDGIHGGSQDGVDLNRNYPFGFGGVGSSGSFTSQIYRGPHALSEPETHAFDALFHRRSFDVSISYHNYGQLLLYPWGAMYQDAPDRQLFHALAVEWSDMMRQVHNVFYRPQAAAQLYFASGDSDDHLYDAYDVAAYTFELRPLGVPPGFELPAEEIIPTFEENLPQVLHTLQLSPDPTLTGVQVFPAAAGLPAAVELTLANHGDAPAGVDVRLYVDEITPQRRINQATAVFLEANQSALPLTLHVDDPPPADSRIYAVVASRMLTDADPTNNQLAFRFPDGAQPPPRQRVVQGHLAIGRATQSDPRHLLTIQADDGSGAWLALYAAWDEHELHLTCQVHDPGDWLGDLDDPLQGDLCIIRLDRGDGGGWFQPDHVGILLGGTPDAPHLRVRRGNGADGWLGPATGYPVGAPVIAGSNEHYVWQAAVAWADLGGAPGPHETWGFDVAWLDRDQQGLRKQTWHGRGEDAHGWGRVTFSPATDDLDTDGIPDDLEWFAPPEGRSSLVLADSDGDGLPDGIEDANRDGLRSPGETATRLRDSDGDGLTDGVEVLLLQTDPLDPASPGVPMADNDRDELPDLIDPDPNNPDTDGDWVLDGYEAVTLGLDAVVSPALVPALGDINGDGVVTNVDGLITQALFLRVAHPAAFVGFRNADPTRDGHITNLDALMIQAFFLGGLAHWPLTGL